MKTSRIAAALLTGTMLAGAAGAATLDVALDSSPAGLDPHLVTAFNSVMMVQGTIYQGLTDTDANLDVVPALATGWTVSDDGLTYTFTLRQGVTFHDGSAFDSADAAASLRRVLSKDIASPLASRISPIADIATPDAQTLVVTLSAPFAPLLSSLSGIAMVPAEAETNKDALQKTPVGTGPYRFVEWQPNGFLSLVAHDGYNGPVKPQVGEVKYHFVPEAATRAAGLIGGDYDILPSVDPATALQLKSTAGVTVHESRELGYTLVGMNTTRGPLGDARVREAVNMLLNRQEIIDGALFGAGVPGGPLSPALKGWALDTAEFPCYATDVDGAKAKLAEAGVTGPVKIVMKVLPRQDTRDIAQVVQQQLAAGGFEVELVNQEIGQFVQDWRNSEFDMFVSANGGAADPDQYFYRTFYSGGSTNVFKYDDPGLNKLLDDGRNSIDPAARKAAYDAAQRQLACTGPVAHIAYGTLSTATGPKVSGFALHPLGRLTGIAGVSLAE